MWVYDGQEKRARYVLPPKGRRKRRSTQGSSVTTAQPKQDDLEPDATNRQQPWRYGQKTKK